MQLFPSKDLRKENKLIHKSGRKEDHKNYFEMSKRPTYLSEESSK